MKKTLLLLVSAVIVLALFCVSFRNSLLATVDGIQTTAVCTAIKQPTKRQGRRGRNSFLRSTSYHFNFTGEDGEPRAATTHFGAFWIKPKVGDSVPIIYVEGSPSLTYFDSVFHVWMFPAIFGGVLIALGARQVIKLRRSDEVGSA